MPAISNRAVWNFNDQPKSLKYVQGIDHSGISRGHTAVFDTGAQQSMIGLVVWEIIKRPDTWIYAQDVNMC